MKRKLLSFIMLFAVTFGFVSGCKDKESNKEQAVLIENGKEIVAKIGEVSYTADQIYGDFVGLNSSARYIYEELEDLLIKTAVPVSDSMRSRIVNEVEKWKKDIKENATITGTSYKEALASALASEGVSSEEELIDKKIFALQEEIITNQYWNNSKDEYYDNYFKNGYVYHISQILVNVSTNGNYDYFDVEPSNTIVKKIYDVANMLIEGEDFYNVALLYSDDSNTKNKGGDMGMITLNDTSIPNEVKYALASYSIYEEGALLYHPSYLDGVYDGLEAIPEKFINKLGEVYELDTNFISSTSGTSLTSRVRGKNIIFNNLFNSRTYRVLQSDGSEKIDEMDNVKMPLEDVAEFGTKGVQNVIVNEEGHPILVVRSDSGIHFISIRKSAFAGEEELKKYYSTEINELDGYKNYLEKVIDIEGESAKQATIDKLETLAKEYAIMKVSGNSNFSGNEDFIRYDMFNSYLNKTYNGVKFEIVNKNIENIVLNYINSQKEYIQSKIDNVFKENYILYANKAEYADSVLVKKQIPLLSCLNTASDGKYACTYTYKDGFKVYAPETNGGGQ